MEKKTRQLTTTYKGSHRKSRRRPGPVIVPACSSGVTILNPIFFYAPTLIPLASLRLSDAAGRSGIEERKSQLLCPGIENCCNWLIFVYSFARLNLGSLGGACKIFPRGHVGFLQRLQVSLPGWKFGFTKESVPTLAVLQFFCID